MRGRKPLLSPLGGEPLSKHVFWSWPELTLVLTRPGAEVDEVDGVWDTIHLSGFSDLWRAEVPPQVPRDGWSASPGSPTSDQTDDPASRVRPASVAMETRERTVEQRGDAVGLKTRVQTPNVGEWQR